jgi:hypothetical protein
VLKDVLLLSKEKFGIDQLTEGVYPLATIKQSVEVVISTGANNQVEIHHLRQENRELKQLHIRSMRRNHDGVAQQTTTIFHTEFDKFKEVRKKLEQITSQETMLHTVLNIWSTYFVSTYNKLKAHRTIIEDLKKTRDITTYSKSKASIATHIAMEKTIEIELTKQEKEWL